MRSISKLCIVVGTILILRGIGQYNFISFLIGELLFGFLYELD